jgi:hypothetical protein
MAYAGLGRREDAVRAGKRAVALLPVRLDAVAGYPLIRELAVIYARVGDREAAIAELEWALDGPSGLVLSRPLLGIDPCFDSLHGSPGFERLRVP